MRVAPMHSANRAAEREATRDQRQARHLMSAIRQTHQCLAPDARRSVPKSCAGTSRCHVSSVALLLGQPAGVLRAATDLAVAQMGVPWSAPERAAVQAIGVGVVPMTAVHVGPATVVAAEPVRAARARAPATVVAPDVRLTAAVQRVPQTVAVPVVPWNCHSASSSDVVPRSASHAEGSSGRLGVSAAAPHGQQIVPGCLAQRCQP